MKCRLSVLARSALLLALAPLALAPLACIGGPDKTTDGATETTVGSSTTSAGSTTAGTTPDATSTSTATTSASSSPSGGDVGACETPTGLYDPWLEPLEPGPDPCDFAAVEACATDDALPGFRECRGYEIAEDMTVFRWGPCMPSCAPDLAKSARACGPGDAGLSYCSELWVEGASELVWYPCLDPACLPCAPGDTELCGPDTPYPETLKTCTLGSGIPAWFDGDCYT